MILVWALATPFAHAAHAECEEPLGTSKSVDAAEAVKIAKRLKFRNSGHADPVLFMRENDFPHWQILKFIEDDEPNPAVEDPQSLSFWLQIKGFVLGDPHLRNIEARWIFGEKPHTRFAFNDADDAGYGPLVGDVLRLMAVSAAEKIDVRELPEFYYKGLRGKDLETPPVLDRYMGITAKKFLKRQQALYEKDYARIIDALESDGEFNFNSGAGQISLLVDPADPSPKDQRMLETLQNHLGLKVYHDRHAAFVYLKKAGGSGGISRYWLLAPTPEGYDFIWEYKPLSKVPGVAGYGMAQPRALERYDIATALTYTKDRFFTYIHFIMVNDQPSLLRAKLANPLKRQLDRPSGMSLLEKQDLANYAAYELGRFHARQAGHAPSNFAALIKENRRQFKKVLLATAHQIQAVMAIGLEKTAVVAPKK
jgi:hypothetical protein